jgi:hypothetical protein
MCQTNAAFCFGGMHHGLLSHGLISFFQRPPDRLVRDLLDDLQLDQLVRQQPQRPACLALRRFATDDREQSRLLLPVELPSVFTAGRTTVQGGLHALLDALPPHPRHRRLAHLHRLGDSLVHPARSARLRVRLQEDPRMGQLPRRGRPGCDQPFQGRPFVIGQRHHVSFVHALRWLHDPDHPGRSAVTDY